VWRQGSALESALQRLATTMTEAYAAMLPALQAVCPAR
jgi:hypothetical protein